MPSLTYRPGDVALVRSPGVAAWGIRVGTRSRFNHARLVTDTDGGTVEARPHGAVRGWVRPGDVVVRPPLTVEEVAALPWIGASLIGVGYGWLGVVALGLAQFGLKEVPWVKDRIARSDELFCSQLVDVAWTLAGFHAYTDRRTPQDVSPGDLADLAFRSGWELVPAPLP